MTRSTRPSRRRSPGRCTRWRTCFRRSASREVDRRQPHQCVQNLRPRRADPRTSDPTWPGCRWRATSSPSTAPGAAHVLEGTGHCCGRCSTDVGVDDLAADVADVLTSMPTSACRRRDVLADVVGRGQKKKNRSLTETVGKQVRELGLVSAVTGRDVADGSFDQTVAAGVAGVLHQMAHVFPTLGIEGMTVPTAPVAMTTEAAAASIGPPRIRPGRGLDGRRDRRRRCRRRRPQSRHRGHRGAAVATARRLGRRRRDRR